MAIKTRTTRNILLVDDDNVQRALLTMQLEKAGYCNVMQASSGAHALTQLADTNVDLVICDLNMPTMDGIELLRHLARLVHSPDVIVLSGVDPRVVNSAEQLTNALGLNLVAAITKPCDSQGLLKLLATHSMQREPKRSFREISANDLRSGLEQGALEFAVQPKVRLSDMRVQSVEALARWRDASGRLLDAGAFIDVAERNGMIARVTDEMITIVLRAMQNASLLPEPLKVSINVSIDDLADVSFADTLVARAGRLDISLARVTLEVTESRVMTNRTGPLDILSRLRMRGLDLSIDDFGTGAAGFENLQLLPFNELKIDRAFVDGVATDASKRVILESMIRVAKVLDLTTVAEGVETGDDLAVLQELGCDLAQGFLFAGPMAPAELPAWIESHDNTYNRQLA